jgi:hypothetical protein
LAAGRSPNKSIVWLSKGEPPGLSGKWDGSGEWGGRWREVRCIFPYIIEYSFIGTIKCP